MSKNCTEFSRTTFWFNSNRRSWRFSWCRHTVLILGEIFAHFQNGRRTFSLYHHLFPRINFLYCWFYKILIKNPAFEVLWLKNSPISGYLIWSAQKTASTSTSYVCITGRINNYVSLHRDSRKWVVIRSRR